MRLNAKAQRYLPQDMFRASSTQPGLLWSNCCSEYSRISAAFSNNARQKSCSLKLSLFSTSTNIRGLKQWVIMKGDQWKGPLIWGDRGQVMYGLTGRREGKLKEWGEACMYVFGGRLGSAAASMKPSKTSTHFLCWYWLVLSRPSTSQCLCVCVLFTVQASYGFIKLPKERKCGSCSDFPLPVIKLCVAFAIK